MELTTRLTPPENCDSNDTYWKKKHLILFDQFNMIRWIIMFFSTRKDLLFGFPTAFSHFKRFYGKSYVCISIINVSGTHINIHETIFPLIQKDQVCKWIIHYIDNWTEIWIHEHRLFLVVLIKRFNWAA